jgi:hypothetical protein
MTPDPSLNIFGEPLEACSSDPLTGYFRNGACDTCNEDTGSHTVCAVMTAEFLAFSKYVGNDLSTPRPEYGFAGLQPGDAPPKFMRAPRICAPWISFRSKCWPYTLSKKSTKADTFYSIPARGSSDQSLWILG